MFRGHHDDCYEKTPYKYFELKKRCENFDVQPFQSRFDALKDQRSKRTEAARKAIHNFLLDQTPF